MLNLFTRMIVHMFLTISVFVLLFAFLFWSWELCVVGIMLGVMAFMTLSLNYQFDMGA